MGAGAAMAASFSCCQLIRFAGVPLAVERCCNGLNMGVDGWIAEERVDGASVESNESTTSPREITASSEAVGISL